jgi:hypothetical protein
MVVRVWTLSRVVAKPISVVTAAIHFPPPLPGMSSDSGNRVSPVPISTKRGQELRASGETSRRREAGAPLQLTPPEIHSVQMAAAGLRIPRSPSSYTLSRHAVESHPTGVFPKIEVTSRA